MIVLSNTGGKRWGGGEMQGCNRSVGVEHAGSKPASIHAQASRVLPWETNPKPIQFPIQLQRGRRKANRVYTHTLSLHCPEDSTFNLPLGCWASADQQHGSCARSWRGVAVLSPWFPGDDVLVVTMTPRGWERLYWLRWVSWLRDGSGDGKPYLCNGNGCFGS